VGVPLLASWPGHFPAGRRVSEVVSLLDVGPTLLDLAGTEPLAEVAGESLRPLWTPGADRTEWRNEALAEHCGSLLDPSSRMIRQGPWKLVHYEGYEPQLFNLEEDPDEWHDRATDPACAEIRHQLQARVLENWNPSEIEPILARRRRDWSLLAQWGRTVHPPDPDFWIAPEGCNVFPYPEASG